MAEMTRKCYDAIIRSHDSTQLHNDVIVLSCGLTCDTPLHKHVEGEFLSRINKN